MELGSITTTGDDGPDCFVCFEPVEACGPNAGEAVTCACRGVFVHHHCLIRMIQARDDRKCGVCRVEYKNVVVQTRKQLRCTPHGLVAGTLAIGALCVGAMACILLALPHYRWYGYFFGVIFNVIAIALAMVAVYYLVWALAITRTPLWLHDTHIRRVAITSAAA